MNPEGPIRSNAAFMWRGPCVLPIHVENGQSPFSQVAALGGYDGGPVIKQRLCMILIYFVRFCVWRLVGPGRSWCKGQQDREDQGSIVYAWKCESEQCETVTGLECVRRNIDAICRFHCIELFCLLAAYISLNSITPCRQPMLVIACHSAVAETEVPRKACQKAGLEAFALQSNIFGRCLASRIFEVLPWCSPGQRFFFAPFLPDPD